MNGRTGVHLSAALHPHWKINIYICSSQFIEGTVFFFCDYIFGWGRFPLRLRPCTDEKLDEKTTRLLYNNFKGMCVCARAWVYVSVRPYVFVCRVIIIYTQLWLLDLLLLEKLMGPNSILTYFYLQKHFLTLCHVNFHFRLLLDSWKYTQKFDSQTWFPTTEIINQMNFKKITQFNFLEIKKKHVSHKYFAVASLFLSVEVNKHISL